MSGCGWRVARGSVGSHRGQILDTDGGTGSISAPGQVGCGDWECGQGSLAACHHWLQFFLQSVLRPTARNKARHCQHAGGGVNHQAAKPRHCKKYLRLLPLDSQRVLTLCERNETGKKSRPHSFSHLRPRARLPGTLAGGSCGKHIRIPRLGGTPSCPEVERSPWLRLERSRRRSSR